ncbi:hypothetical protein, partial [Bradyrhizobium diazoefficiens]
MPESTFKMTNLSFGAFLRFAFAVIFAQAALAASSDEVLDHFRASLRAIRADINLSPPTPGSDSETQSLRQFSQFWRSVPAEVSSQAGKITRKNSLSFDQFVTVGDQVICSITQLDSPETFSSLKQQLEDIQRSDDQKQNPSSDESVKKRIMEIQDDLEFCSKVSD